MKQALTISLVLHAALFAVIAYVSLPQDVPLGDGIVSVEIMGDEESEEPKIGKTSDKSQVTSHKSQVTGHESQVTGHESQVTGHESQVTSPGSQVAGYGSSKGDPTLAKIRAKIERAKYYPALAKRQKLTGTPVVSFKIGPLGEGISPRIEKTSGIEALDQAALETLQRATPLPNFDDLITLAIKYTLAY